MLSITQIISVTPAQFNKPLAKYNNNIYYNHRLPARDGNVFGIIGIMRSTQKRKNRVSNTLDQTYKQVRDVYIHERLQN